MLLIPGVTIPLLVCCDIDGTIHRKGLFNVLVAELVKRGIVPDHVLRDPDLLAARHSWERRQGSFGEYSGQMVRAFFQTLSIKGVQESVVSALAEQLVPEYHDHIWHFPRCLLSALRNLEQAKLVAISGSPIQIVQPFSRHWGFHDAVGTELELDADHCFTSDDSKSVLHYRNKAAVVQRFQELYSCPAAQTLAMGNTMDDIPMLMLARWPLVMNPNQATARLARDLQMPVVMEYDDAIHLFRSKDAGGPLVQTTLDDCLPPALVPHIRTLIADRL